MKLQWAHVDLARRTLTILEQKNGTRDTLPVNDTAMAVLLARAAVWLSSTDAVFVNGAGHPRNARNLLRAFYPAMRKAGIARFRFHDLRHTCATRLIQARVDVFTVQKLGRWKTISMVLRYAHHQPESLRGGAEVLDRLRRESSTNLYMDPALAATTACHAMNHINAGLPLYTRPLGGQRMCPGLDDIRARSPHEHNGLG